MSLTVRANQGQSTIEALFALTLTFVMLAGIVQLLWILLAQQLQQAATMYIANHVAISPERVVDQQLIYAARMKALPGRGLTLPRIRLLQPDEETASLIAPIVDGQYQVDLDFAAVRTESLTDDELRDWLYLATLELEIMGCMPLHVPYIGELFVSAARWTAFADFSYCQVQQLGHKPMWPIQTTVKVPWRGSQRRWSVPR